MGWAARFKPGASIRAHLFTAALTWSFIGLYLMLRACSVLGPASTPLFWGALGIGALKSRLLLDRAARRNAARILARQDGQCLGGVYSLRMWGLVIGMMLGGRLVRQLFGASLLVGVVYLAAGFALLLSSRLLWQQWRHKKTTVQSAGID